MGSDPGTPADGDPTPEVVTLLAYGDVESVVAVRDAAQIDARTEHDIIVEPQSIPTNSVQAAVGPNADTAADTHSAVLAYQDRALPDDDVVSELDGRRGTVPRVEYATIGDNQVLPCPNVLGASQGDTGSEERPLSGLTQKQGEKHLAKHKAQSTRHDRTQPVDQLVPDRRPEPCRADDEFLVAGERRLGWVCDQAEYFRALG